MKSDEKDIKDLTKTEGCVCVCWVWGGPDSISQDAPLSLAWLMNENRCVCVIVRWVLKILVCVACLLPR